MHGKVIQVFQPDMSSWISLIKVVSEKGLEIMPGSEDMLFYERKQSGKDGPKPPFFNTDSSPRLQLFPVSPTKSFNSIDFDTLKSPLKLPAIKVTARTLKF